MIASDGEWGQIQGCATGLGRATRALEQWVVLGSNLDTLGALGCYRDTPRVSAQG